MPDRENRMLIVAVAPQWLVRQIDADQGDAVRRQGEWFVTDVMDTTVELTDDDVRIQVIVTRKPRRDA